MPESLIILVNFSVYPGASQQVQAGGRNGQSKQLVWLPSQGNIIGWGGYKSPLTLNSSRNNSKLVVILLVLVC